jgi:hypothetical protein
MLLLMKLAELLNLKYQQEALVIVRRSEWYGCGWICTETVVHIYIVRNRGSKEMDRCPLTLPQIIH